MADAIDTSNWPAGTRYFTQVTDGNHAGWLYVITILCFVYVCITSSIRFVVKYGMYGRDDWALLVATVLGVGQYISIIAGIREGVGKSSRLISIDQVDEIEKYVNAHMFLYFLAHCASKMSTALLTQRLFGNDRTRNTRLCWGLVGASAVYGLGAVLAAAVSCPTAAFPVDNHDICGNRFLRWQIILALDIVTEALLVIVPLFLILDVMIKGSAKITVSIVFAFRLLDILLAALNLRQIAILEHTDDYGVDVVPAVIWTQSELLWSIFSASLPCLKTFLRPLDRIDDDTERPNHDVYSSSRSGGRTYNGHGDQEGAVPLGLLRDRIRDTSLSAPGSDRRLGSRPERIDHVGVIPHPTTRGSMIDDVRRSWGSQERIIKASTHCEAKFEGGKNPYEMP